MDKVACYRRIVRQPVEDYARLISRGNQEEILPVCDAVHDQYRLVSLG